MRCCLCNSLLLVINDKLSCSNPSCSLGEEVNPEIFPEVLLSILQKMSASFLLSEAEMEGRKAYYDKIANNPYPQNSKSYVYWVKGWMNEKDKVLQFQEKQIIQEELRKAKKELFAQKQETDFLKKSITSIETVKFWTAKGYRKFLEDLCESVRKYND